MLRLSILISSLAFAFAALAESVDVKDVDTSEGSTTIEIHKNKRKEAVPAPDAPAEVKAGGATVHAETMDVEGDPAPLASEARKNWKDACSKQEKKAKDEGKESGDIVFGWNCGKASCSGDAGNKVCNSTATYKVKTKNN